MLRTLSLRLARLEQARTPERPRRLWRVYLGEHEDALRHALEQVERDRQPGDRVLLCRYGPIATPPPHDEAPDPALQDRLQQALAQAHRHRRGNPETPTQEASDALRES